MLGLLGQSGCGKDFVAKKLSNCFGYERIVAYTTRPPRQGEVNGVDYYFVVEEEFAYLAASDFFGEHTAFDTVYGIWRYGTPKDKYSDNALIILNPDSLIQLAESYDNLITYELHIDRDSQIKKLMERGDNEAEIMRRLSTDKAGFENVQRLVHKHIWNTGYGMPPQYLAAKINQDYQKLLAIGR